MVIETHDLSKRYGRVVAVEGLNLQVGEGEVFGLLGPNGSGKTTTILMLLGLTEPTSGTAQVLGHDPVREPLSVKRQVGYLPDSVGFYGEMTAWENLRYTTRLLGLPRLEAEKRIGEVLERMGLADVAQRPVATFSRGMRQRLGLAEVLLKRPKVAILDEPTLGLDPEAALEFLAMIRGLKAEGITVLLSSHLLHQVQAICDRVGLFHRGRMVLVGTVRDLAERVLGGAYRIRLRASAGASLAERLKSLEGVGALRQQDGSWYLEARRDLRPELARAVLEAGGELLELGLEEPSLDEVYARYFQEVRHAEAA
ncbi:ABC transporter ATP-binding protein [Calidithermus roseus]|uniref:ABC transporter ATP-binding protein NatA n=1 Tax=Calidithermus roseus TaxID=1644118 RepID=A0A399ENU0_9DEIN|nr:ABC transporter ATP-binding protein [Calidithermus roseus]RIH86384.1 ABC transporter ATP-binding protein NatA [Calidithermus roseus]